MRKIREAKAALELEAKHKAEAQADEARDKLSERARQEAATGKKVGGTEPKVPDGAQAKPEPKAQRNFTDPPSRIKPDGANKGAFIQAYNAQIAVDAQAQIIVAALLTQAANDVQQLVPMAEAMVQSVGRLAETTSADAGYFSEQNITHPAVTPTNLLVPPHRQKQGEEPTQALLEPNALVAQQMRHKLAAADAHEMYKRRKAIVEPVFGQIKEVRGFRRFVLRGLEAVGAEFAFIVMTHNLLKLFCSSARPVVGAAMG